MKKFLLIALLLPVGSMFGMQDNRQEAEQQIRRFDKVTEDRYYTMACLLGGITGAFQNKQNPLLGAVAGTLASGLSFYTVLCLGRKCEARFAGQNGAVAK